MVQYGPWPSWLTTDSPVRAAVESAGIERLWTHQSVTADALAAGHHVVLTTGTASGKSLAYLLPLAAAAIGANLPATASGSADPESSPVQSSPVQSSPMKSASAGSATAAVGTRPATTGVSKAGPAGGVRWRRRPATSLYLAPTKALAHDQARACIELAIPGWRVAVVDGDTDRANREWARDHAHHVLTNPDLLHASLLPNHPRWASFLRSLRFVVVDESHRYRGLFGAQVAAVLRRLRRIAAHYGADPAFAVLSATTAEPEQTTASLTGIDADSLLVVSEDGSPRGPIRISLASPSNRAAEDAAAELMADRVSSGRQVLTFVPSRRLAEEIARSAAQLAGPRSGEVVAYRAGYLATDRRAIERGLNDGSVRGVAATNALELGVDIAGLDTVVMCGYPRQRAAFWQQAGRAGRRGESAEVVLIARPNPMDAYLLDHPEALFDHPVEAPVLDPGTAPVLGPQLAAAAQELPLRPGDERWFGARTWPIVARLTDLGLLRRRPDGWYWTSPNRAVDRINLRTADRHTLDIVEQPTGRVLGTVSAAEADRVVHPGAVYLHQGDTYLSAGPDDPLAGPDDEGTASAATWKEDDESAEPDVRPGEVYVRAARPGYLTQPQVDTAVLLADGALPGGAEQARVLGSGRLSYGPVQVRSTVTGYLRRDELTGQVWDSTPLNCPERVLATTAVTIKVPAVPLAMGIDQSRPLSRARIDAGLHALEHLLAAMLATVVTSDVSDIGSHSWLAEDESADDFLGGQQPDPGNPDLGNAAPDPWSRQVDLGNRPIGNITVFDRQPGSGYAVRAYERADAWLAAAADRITHCPCDNGCPACILSPGCGSSRPLDKPTCRRLLNALLGSSTASANRPQP